MSSNEIYIGNLDKATVLAALYNHARPKGLGTFQYEEGDMGIDEAKDILGMYKSRSFDYLKGRVMKVDLYGDSFDPRLYNRDNGDNAAEEIINQLKKEANSYEF